MVVLVRCPAMQWTTGGIDSKSKRLTELELRVESRLETFCREICPTLLTSLSCLSILPSRRWHSFKIGSIVYLTWEDVQCDERRPAALTQKVKGLLIWNCELNPGLRLSARTTRVSLAGTFANSPNKSLMPINSSFQKVAFILKLGREFIFQGKMSSNAMNNDRRRWLKK